MSTSFANKMSNCAKSVWLDITWAFKTIVHNSYEWWWKCCQRNTSNQQKSLTIYKFSFLPWNGRCWPEIKQHSARLAKWKISIFHVDCVFYLSSGWERTKSVAILIRGHATQMLLYALLSIIRSMMKKNRLNLIFWHGWNSLDFLGGQ